METKTLNLKIDKERWLKMQHRKVDTGETWQEIFDRLIDKELEEENPEPKEGEAL